MELNDIKKIDIKHSKGAEKQDDGTWTFDDMVEVDYMAKDRRPDHFYTWARYDKENNFRDLNTYKHSLGYKEVIPSEEEDVYPLGCPVEDGFYVFLDAIFVKIPLIAHLERLVNNAELGRKQLSGKIMKFKQSMRGDGIVQSDAEAEEMIKYFGVAK